MVKLDLIRANVFAAPGRFGPRIIDLNVLLTNLAIAGALASERSTGREEGFALARDRAEVSEDDGWHRTAPFIDWTCAEVALAKAQRGTP